jgi:hypothetical protein
MEESRGKGGLAALGLVPLSWAGPFLVLYFVATSNSHPFETACEWAAKSNASRTLPSLQQTDTEYAERRRKWCGLPELFFDMAPRLGRMDVVGEARKGGG